MSDVTYVRVTSNGTLSTTTVPFDVPDYNKFTPSGERVTGISVRYINGQGPSWSRLAWTCSTTSSLGLAGQQATSGLTCSRFSGSPRKPEALPLLVSSATWTCRGTGSKVSLLLFKEMSLSRLTT